MTALPVGWVVRSPDEGKFAAAHDGPNGHYLHKKWRDTQWEAERDAVELAAKWAAEDLRRMRFDPAKGLELDLLAPPVCAPDLIEQTESRKNPRPGWASPRRRPRRVYKKLAARGFKANFEPAPRYTGASPAVQQRDTRYTAPELAAWLAGGARAGADESPVSVRFWPLMFDGKGPPTIAPIEHWDRERIEFVEEPAIDLALESDWPPPLIKRITVTWTGHELRQGLIVVSPRSFATRRFQASLVIFTPPGVNITADIKHRAARAIDALHVAILSAVRGLSSTKIVARQTCYRPT